MSLILHKEAYILNEQNLYRVTAMVNGEKVHYSIQCLQTKPDADIETLMIAQLLSKGYTSDQLIPITWN